MTHDAPSRSGARVKALLTGIVCPLTKGGPVSGIHKAPAKGPLWVDKEGLGGDEQGNRRHHGGAEKALHHYPWDHYAYWRQWFRDPPGLLAAPGAFGENLSTEDLTEADVCIGDVFGLGGATIQVSQVRQPCATLNTRFGIPDMARRVQESGRTGWYYRVGQPGRVAAGASLRLLERPHPRWPLTRLIRLLFLAPYDFAEQERLLALSGVAECHRQLVRRRLETGQVEDWGKRLGITN